MGILSPWSTGWIARYISAFCKAIIRHQNDGESDDRDLKLISSLYDRRCMSHVTKEEICDVDGCDKVAERSLNIKKVSETSVILKNPDARSVHLCKDHYKILKKETKGDIPDYLG